MIFGKKQSFFGRLSAKIGDAVMGRPAIDEEMYDELEEALITSDMSMDTTMNIIERLKKEVKSKWPEPEEVPGMLRDIISDMMDKGEKNKLSDETPLVILMIGINGGGKTTSIGKIAYKCIKSGKSVLLAAADTFRAAAADQLAIWAERVGVDIIRHQEGSDPSAVIFDAIAASKARGTDVLICDTAGRLQTKKNLMDELAKMNRIIDRDYPEAVCETLLVIDATTGKNAISQVKEFNESTQISGIVLTKLDGTARGGIVVTIAYEFDMPVKYIGVGEGMEDLQEFDPHEFAGGIIDE